MNDKINLTYDDMVALAKISLENGREHMYIPAALEWMKQANNALIELKESNKLLRVELENEKHISNKFEQQFNQLLK